MKQAKRGTFGDIYLTVGRKELLIHVPFHVIIEEITPPVMAGIVQKPDFTNREDQIVDGLRRGLSNKQIGAEVNLSERTVKFHVSKVLEKLQVRSRHEILTRLGMVREGESR